MTEETKNTDKRRLVIWHCIDCPFAAMATTKDAAQQNLADHIEYKHLGRRSEAA